MIPRADKSGVFPHIHGVMNAPAVDGRRPGIQVAPRVGQAIVNFEQAAEALEERGMLLEACDRLRDLATKDHDGPIHSRLACKGAELQARYVELVLHTQKSISPGSKVLEVLRSLEKSMESLKSSMHEAIPMSTALTKFRINESELGEALFRLGDSGTEERGKAHA